MVLTKEENELLTRVGPGTPMGELLRRYWYPIAPMRELTDEQPTRFVRILGEDLVLYKDKSGRAGLLQDHCAHRGASLLYGRVEERGIACAYHGWLYDASGQCLECPAEPAGSMFHLTVKMAAYPVQEWLGMYWAYLGPQPAPPITKFDVWARRDGTHKISVQPALDCNWLQPMENSVDPAHLPILHQTTSTQGRKAPSTTRGFTDDIDHFDFYETPYGLMKRRTYKNGLIDQHPLVFPNILRHQKNTQIRVPVDDTHTYIVFIGFEPNEDGSIVDEDPMSIPVRYVPSYKEPVGQLHPYARFTDFDREVQTQDHAAWETQGPIQDRSKERLATSDRGIVMLRQMLVREVEKVQRGEDPMNVYHDPEHEVVDTNLEESVRDLGRWRGAAPPPETPAPVRNRAY
ncbi:MAG: 5,5-dehydrodivanillate O-demethylase oxygenase subunit [Chloroflexota bacterium]|jgi:5,5'-dehydrodivanillate O-demethylase|nr:5,5-dehydrodivanillate O-demethylase oxygenase subunit [Chloroflexota bacterium]